MENTEVKICPQCSAEYYAHIEICKDCEIELISPASESQSSPEDDYNEYNSQNDAPSDTVNASSKLPIDGLPGSSCDIDTEGGDLEETANLEGITVKYIDSGPMTRLTELSNVLTSSGIDSSIVAGPPNSCSSDKALVVRAEEADKAMEVVTEYWKRVHPELAKAMQNADEGFCPACGADTSANPNECSDCGLMLVIEDPA